MRELLKKILNKSSIHGSIDVISESIISGWALDLSNKYVPIEVFLYDQNNIFIEKKLANQYRSDLRDEFGVDCGFSIEFNKDKFYGKIFLKDKKGKLISTKDLNSNSSSSVQNDISKWNDQDNTVLKGFIDQIEPNKITGWAYSNVGNNESLNLVIENEIGEILSSVKSGLFRSDLINHNSGRCGFIAKTNRPIRNGETIFIKDEKGNLIFKKLAELEENENVSDGSDGISGKIESLKFGILKGWGSNLKNTGNKTIRLLDDQNNILAEGVPTIFRDDIANIPPGKNGFILHLINEINHSSDKIFLEVGGKITDEFELDNIKFDYERLLLSGEFDLAWKFIVDSNDINQKKLNSLVHIFDEAVNNHEWQKIEKIISDGDSAFETEIVSNQLISLLIEVSKTPKSKHYNLSIDHQLDLFIKFSFKCRSEIQHDYHWIEDEILSIIDLILFYRKDLSEESYQLINKVYFKSSLEKYSDIYKSCKEAIKRIPILPKSDVNLLALTEDVETHLNSLPEIATHSLRYNFLMFLSTLSSNTEGCALLKDSATTVLNHLENYNYSVFDQRYLGVKIDILFLLESTNQLVAVLQEALQSDLNSLIWSSRKIDDVIALNYMMLLPKIRKLAVDLLELKADQERISQQGAIILADLELGELNNNRIRPVKIRNVLNGLIAFRFDKDVREKISQLFISSKERGTIIPGYSDWVKYKNLIDNNYYSITEYFTSSVFPILQRDYMVKLINNRIIPLEDIDPENNNIKSLILQFDQDISDAYKEYLIKSSERYGIELYFDTQEIADLKLSVNTGFLVSHTIFKTLKTTQNQNLAFINSDGKNAATLKTKNDLSILTQSIVTNDCFLTKSKDEDKYIRDEYGIIRTDDAQSAELYFSQILNKFPESELINIGKDSLYSISVDTNAIKNSELVCIIVQRNERKRLLNCLDYYRLIGVDRFVIIDNNSDDDTFDFLLNQKDVDLYSTPQPYSSSKYGVDWIDMIVRLYRNDKWCLVVDADEELKLDDQFRNIKEAINFLDANNFDALYTPFLDVYPKGSFKDHPVEMKANSKNEYYHDSRWYTIFASHGGYHNLLPTFQGGVRHRKFGLSSVVLNKVPLFKFNKKMILREGVHWLSMCNPYFDNSSLLHHKYNCLFHDYVIRESQRGEHWNGAVEYKKYNEELSKNNSLSLFDSLFSTLVE